MSFTGCVTRDGLTVEERKYVNEADVEIAVPQDEIIADFNRSQMATYGGGGALLAIIDAAVDHHNAGKSDNLAQIIHENLETYDFEGSLKRAIQQAGKLPFWLKTDQVTLHRELTSKEEAALLEANSDPTIIITARYSILPKFDGVSIAYIVEIFSSEDDDKPVYKNNFLIQDIYPQCVHKKAKDNAVVLQQNVHKIRKSLDFCQTKFVEALRYDLELGEDYKSEGTGPNMVFDGLVVYSGKNFKTVENVHWARSSSGDLFVARGKEVSK